MAPQSWPLQLGDQASLASRICSFKPTANPPAVAAPIPWQGTCCCFLQCQIQTSSCLFAHPTHVTPELPRTAADFILAQPLAIAAELQSCQAGSGWLTNPIAMPSLHVQRAALSRWFLEAARPRCQESWTQPFIFAGSWLVIPAHL